MNNSIVSLGLFWDYVVCYKHRNVLILTLQVKGLVTFLDSAKYLYLVISFSTEHWLLMF